MASLGRRDGACARTTMGHPAAGQGSLCRRMESQCGRVPSQAAQERETLRENDRARWRRSRFRFLGRGIEGNRPAVQNSVRRDLSPFAERACPCLQVCPSESGGRGNERLLHRGGRFLGAGSFRGWSADEHTRIQGQGPYNVALHRGAGSGEVTAIFVGKICAGFTSKR